MRIRVAGLSNPGTTRTKNDDHYCIGTFVEQDATTALTIDTHSATFRQYGLLAAVADGMGGYAGGALASRIVLETLSAQFFAQKREGSSAAELALCLAHCLEQTQRVLGAVLGRSPDLHDTGTTLAGVALMPPDALVVFHVGDSRVLRASGGFMRPLTVDHTPIGPDVASGRVSEQEAADLAAASQLTRSMGLQGDTRADVSQELTWSPGDQFLLGTDGFHGLGRGLPRLVLTRAFRTGRTAEILVDQLIREAVATDGRDNATAVIVQIEEECVHEPGDAASHGRAA